MDRSLYIVFLLVTGFLFTRCSPEESSQQLVESKLENGRAGNHQLWVYIGTFTRGEARGIYRTTLDLSTGSLSAPELAAETESPAFLALHPNRRVLYAVNEVNQFQGQEAGGVSSFQIDASSGDLSLLNQVSAGGAGPCHIMVDEQGKNVLIANYGAGSITAFPIRQDGRIEPASSIVQHQGSSVDPNRQKGPHAHAVVASPDGNSILAVDLGLDQILIYRFDPTTGQLEPGSPPAVDLAPGSGPRHFAFHPNGRFGYSINELDSTITAFQYEAGQLEEIQTVSTLPENFEGENYPAEVMIHPDGQFLYGSNRGHDSIAIYQIDQGSGELTAVGHEPTRGPTPRYFGIEPTGQYLLSASQQDGLVSVFQIDPSRGTLQFAGQSIEVPSPVCLLFVEPGA